MMYLLSIVQSCLVMLSTLGSGVVQLSALSMVSMVMWTITDQSPRIGLDRDASRSRRVLFIKDSKEIKSTKSFALKSVRPVVFEACIR